MRLTLPRYKHNLWRQFKATWQVQRLNRKIIETPSVKILKQQNIPVYDAKEIAALPKYSGFIDISGNGPGPMAPKTEQEMPDYHEERVFIYRDSNVLLEGLEQAKLLTNTVEPEPESLPQQIVSLIDTVSSPIQDKLVKRCILSSAVYEAEQVKLPIRKDPKKRMWVFPRDYGISQERKSRLLFSRLIQLCEMISGGLVSQERLSFRDACFSTAISWRDRRILLDLKADLLLTSTSGLPPLATASSVTNIALPNLGCLLPTVSLEQTNVYRFEDQFPLKGGNEGKRLHTAIIHCDTEGVKNIYGTEVLQTQLKGRCLMKAFAFAVAQARHLYGNQSKDSGELPSPVTTQVVQTNGQWFQFSILQLNTTNPEHSSIRNIFWSSPMLDLYSFCNYEEGKPVLLDYNPEVFKTLLAFYNNGS